jgi:peptidoglycan/LPS O-acetylase OafA/YrhL
MWASEGKVLTGPIWQFFSNQGNLGVRIFFTLSGFLITYLLLDENNRTGKISLRAFYMRRIFRIFPVYYLYLAVLATSQIFQIYNDAGSTWLGALTFTRNLIGQGDSATGHLWSLAVEEQFYLAWPSVLVILGLSKRNRAAWVLFLAVILAAIIARMVECDGKEFLCRALLHPNSALRYADCLAIGCLGAFVYANGQPSQRLSRMIAPVAAFLLAMSTLLPLQFGLFSASIVLHLQSWLAVVAIIASANAGQGVWFRFLNARPVVFIGIISYSLYIWHMIFLRPYVGTAFPLGPFGKWYIWWIASIFIASVSYYGLEKPILKLSKQWRR